jgi:flavorubredoxin/flavin reductase (DIM6/NTAB) family NADH-FMN oxidoreductase RutF
MSPTPKARRLFTTAKLAITIDSELPMTSAMPAQRDLQIVNIAADTWVLRSRSFSRLKFEVEYALQRGTTSNAYVIQGNQRAVLITPPGEAFTEKFLEELEHLIPLAEITDVILGHINPNRFYTLLKLLERAPHLQIICSNPGSVVLKSLFEAESNPPPIPELLVMRGQEVLKLGSGHRLQFIPAPTPRWPEGLCVYDDKTKILFTDKFFGVHVCSDAVFDESGSADTLDERHYYDCLMASQARQVETVLDRFEEWPAQTYAPVHGSLLHLGGLERLEHYREWNRQQLNQTLCVALLYASAYGSTATLSQAIARGITKAGVAVEAINCEVANSEEIRDALGRSAGFVIGSPTLGGHAPTPIQTALGIVLATADKGQLAGVFGSFGWSGEAIDSLVEKLQNGGYTFGFQPIRVKFKPTEATLQECEEAGTDFAQALKKQRKPKQAIRQDATPIELAVGRIVGSLSVVTVHHDDVSSAMLASWISQASFNPPGLTVAVAKDRAIESLLYPNSTFVLNLLEEGKHIALMKQFLKPFAPGEDRFADTETEPAHNGSPILKDALAYLECKVINRMDCGDHWLIYCTADAGNVLNPGGRTAVHFRQTGTHY